MIMRNLFLKKVFQNGIDYINSAPRHYDSTIRTKSTRPRRGTPRHGRRGQRQLEALGVGSAVSEPGRARRGNDGAGRSCGKGPTDRPLIMSDRPLIMSDRPLIMSDRTLIMSDRTLIMSDRPLIMSDRPLIMSDRPLIMSDHPLIIPRLKSRRLDSSLLLFQRRLSPPVN